MVEGVSKGFRKSLEISGVGYRVAKSGERLNLSLGFSHPVSFEAPQGVALTVEGQNKIHVEGIDKQMRRTSCRRYPASAQARAL